MSENIDVQKSQLHRIFQMVILNDFGLGFVNIFIPVFLLKLGYSVPMVMLWSFILDLSFLLVMFVTIYCSNRIGLVHCLQIRFILLISNLWLMTILPTHHFLFFIIPVLMGSDAAFYFIPRNILFLRNTDKNSMGRSFSKLSSYPKLLTILCPVIGAFIISKLGFPTLFIMSMFLVFLASVPLWPLRSEKTNFIFTKDSMLTVWRRSKSFFLPEIISSFAEGGGGILVIFIYINLLSVAQIGIIGSLIAVTGIFFTLTLGKLTDKWNWQKLMRIGAVAVSMVWVYSFYVGQFMSSPWLFYLAIVLLTLSVKIFLVPYQSALFNSGRYDDAQFLVLREIPNVSGRLILYVVVALLYTHLPFVFLLSALLFIYFWFLDLGKLAPSPVTV
ncbi:MAG: MFS transporter [Nitrospira sp.]